MGLPKDIDIDRQNYTDNLLVELRMLNDKLIGMNSVLNSDNEIKKTVEKNWNLLSAFLYLYYESAIIQICWLFGDDANSKVGIGDHLEFLINENGLLEDFASKHIDAEFKSISESERKTRIENRINEFRSDIEDFRKRIDSLKGNERERIKLARHNLFAHKSLLAFNNLFNNSEKAKEVWGYFAPTFEDVQIVGKLAIDIGNYILYVEQNTPHLFQETSMLTVN